MDKIVLNGTKPRAVCNTCTLRLVTIAYERRPTFRLLREPIRLVMRIFAMAYRIDPHEYDVRTPKCRGCVRFYKSALKERSPLFRRLNDAVNPFFDRQLEMVVTEEEVKMAKAYARRATVGELSDEEAVDWMSGNVQSSDERLDSTAST